MNRLTRRHPTFRGMIILYPQRRRIKKSPRTYTFSRSRGKKMMFIRKHLSRNYR